MSDSAFSCDTFVALPPATAHGAVIFGKNSDRPRDEVQEVVFLPARDYVEGETVQCTYISIPQAQHVFAVALSKPAWMWGAEMGCNEQGVCIGNEAVSTKLQADQEDFVERLLGMDLVRLGLERSSCAQGAVDAITGLLEQYGQGGPCTDQTPPVAYHNSFIIADSSEAWVLESAGRHWAAEKITEGVRNISNQLSIGEHMTLTSEGLLDLCKDKGWWHPNEGRFNFAQAMTRDMPPSMFSADEAPDKRFAAGKALLEKQSTNGHFHASNMMEILRNTESCICRVGTGARNIASVGSQVSVLRQDKTAFHWFTATPNPCCSVFKPFVFSPSLPLSPWTKSPTYEKDPAKQQPRFAFTVDRAHELWKAHAALKPLPGDKMDTKKLAAVLQLEKNNLNIMEELIAGEIQWTVDEEGEWWTNAVQAEMNAAYK